MALTITFIHISAFYTPTFSNLPIGFSVVAMPLHKMRFILKIMQPLKKDCTPRVLLG